MTGLLVAAGVLLIVLIFGVYRQRTDGRLRVSTGADSSVTVWPGELGERATLLQFTSPTCAACRPTRRMLADVAAAHEGVTFLEVDAAEHLDLAQTLRVARTPTVFILDGAGAVRHRASGVPRRPEIVSALQPVSHSA